MTPWSMKWKKDAGLEEALDFSETHADGVTTEEHIKRLKSMTNEEIDGCEDYIEMSYDRLPRLEEQLIEVAHKMSMDTGNNGGQETGRCLKFLIPAWIAYLEAERLRPADSGPGESLHGCIRAVAFIASMNASLAFDSSSKEKVDNGIEALIASFRADMECLVKGAIEVRKSKDN